MTTPTSTIELPSALGPAALWTEVASRSIVWSATHGIALRDAIVLLPFAALLPPARRAFAAAGGWMPRIETVQTLAASLGPPPPHEAGQISFDAAFDALVAAPMLQRQSALAGWMQRDRRSFEMAVQRMVETAHDFARAVAALPPPLRDAWLEHARSRLAPLTADPGATERLLARIALEWAAHAPLPATDALFALRPSAWIVMRAGGSTPLAEALAAHSDRPVLSFDADAGVQAGGAAGARLQLAVCDGFEDEAQSAAAFVLDHLSRSQTPVALIAQDRVLVRRVRALLAREGISIADETGWRLSTTRAAAVVMTLLRAARAQASCDEVLDWLKAGAAIAGVDALEAALRRRGISRVSVVDPATFDDPSAQAAWHAAMQRLVALRQPLHRPLAAWLDALRTALESTGLDDDPAGLQVLTALFGARREHAPPLGLPAFSAWVDATLEQGSYVPRNGSSEAAVVITPLARAMLRPFAAVVLPGADATRLGTRVEPHPLLGDTLAVALGLRGVAAQREAQRIAFGQLQRVPEWTVLYRRHDGDEPLAPSPLIERLAIARRRSDRPPLTQRADPRGMRALTRRPLRPPLPVPRGVPERLSASAIEALRDCPYRFFSRSMLSLRDPDELDDEPEKRDYGHWLHAVLLRFHDMRQPADAADEVARLLAIGRELRDEHGLDAAAFMPFAASFERLAPMYVAWQQQRDAQGARFVAGEVERVAKPASLGGVELSGRIDRIDHEHDGHAMLFDYKTGALQGLRDKQREPLEDTQLAVYALLHDDDRPLRAAYLALDASDRVHRVEHADVESSAAMLLDGLAGELQRLRDGAPLPALGSGRVCDTCEARGLCRRDDWSE